MEASHEKIKKETALQSMSNSKALFKDIQTATQKVLELEEQRRSINAKVASVKADLEAKGIDKKAFVNVMNYFKGNLKDRDGYDASEEMCFQALSELQDDLFDRKKVATGGEQSAPGRKKKDVRAAAANDFQEDEPQEAAE